MNLDDIMMNTIKRGNKLMIDFQIGGIYPFVKITTPPEIDFFEEHKNILNKEGFVWFCRFGKNNMRITTINSCNKLLIIKESKQNGGTVYIAKFDMVTDEGESITDSFPNYYNRIDKIKSLWIRLLEIEKFSGEELENRFVLNASGNRVSTILKSMCAAVFLRRV